MITIEAGEPLHHLEIGVDRVGEMQHPTNVGWTRVVPTIFPDGTSQVWKLPEWALEDGPRRVTWWFEEERELIDLLSLFKLLPRPESVALHIPYLPYARQDKPVANDATFNLSVLIDVLGLLHCGPITAVDAHSLVTEKCLPNFHNLSVKAIHEAVIKQFKPTHVVFPDLGAKNRYSSMPFFDLTHLVFYKDRDASTGEIIKHSMSTYRRFEMRTQGVNPKTYATDGDRYLIVDDLCDGGATFISVAQQLRSSGKDIKIHLHVTHGLFSKGREHLIQNGIDSISTTNSLLRNATSEFKV